MKNIYWREEAACQDSPGGGEGKDKESSSARLARLTDFIQSKCNSCPVSQECLDSSYFIDSSGVQVDDLMWTVRGGYLPTALTIKPIGRPAGSTNWKPKPPPEIDKGTRPGHISMLAWGVCTKKLHGILSIDDLLTDGVQMSTGRPKYVCRGCKEASRKVAEKNRAAREPKKRKPRRATECKYGHPLSGNNVIEYIRKDNGRTNRRCRICKSEQDRIRNAGRARMAA